MNESEKNKNRSQWVVCTDNETRYHLTMNYQYNINFDYSQLIIRKFIRMLNKEYFNHNKSKSFIEGFVVNETDKNGRPHHHLLIKNNVIFHERNKPFPDVVGKKLCHFSHFKYDHMEKMVGEYNFVRIFNKKNKKPIRTDTVVKIQDYYHDRLETYLTKEIEYKQNNFDFIRPLTYYGF